MDYGADGWFKGLSSFAGDNGHVVGVGRYRGSVSFSRETGSEVMLSHSKNDYHGFAVKINIETNKAVWATGAGQDHPTGRGESLDVTTTASGHVVISGGTGNEAHVGRLTLLNGATGALVWEESFPSALPLGWVRCPPRLSDPLNTSCNPTLPTTPPCAVQTQQRFEKR